MACCSPTPLPTRLYPPQQRATMPHRVFLDIDIGDAAAYVSASAAYGRATAFLAEVGAQVRDAGVARP